MTPDLPDPQGSHASYDSPARQANLDRQEPAPEQEDRPAGAKECAPPLPEPGELPLPYFVDGDVLGLIGQNKKLRYTWMFLIGAPVVALISNLRLGRVPLLPVLGTGLACLAVFALSWALLSAGYRPARSAPLLFNRRKGQVFLGRFDEAAGSMVYRSLPFAALGFEDAFGGFGSAILNVKVSEPGREPWSLAKFGRLIERRECGDLAALLEAFMRGADVIKPSPKAAAEYARELKKRPPLPPEAAEFLR